MIAQLANSLYLLAVGPPRRNTNFDTEWTILASLAVVVALGLLVSHWISRRRQKEFWCDSSSQLFHDLCRAHRLDRANRRLMQKLASARGVESAAELFVEPDNFDATNLPKVLDSSANELRQLRHELFE
jgi:hypothetical protein